MNNIKKTSKCQWWYARNTINILKPLDYYRHFLYFIIQMKKKNLGVNILENCYRLRCEPRCFIIKERCLEWKIKIGMYKRGLLKLLLVSLKAIKRDLK